jgi:hypothetical protein
MRRHDSDRGTRSLCEAGSDEVPVLRATISPLEVVLLCSDLGLWFPDVPFLQDGTAQRKISPNLSEVIHEHGPNN